jgi:arylsulfatase A-like enzyme
MSSRPFLRALIALGLGYLLSQCDEHGAGKARTPSTQPNVLVIAVDTLRADRLGCFGNARGLTPNIDRLASEGVRFASAFSQAPWTLPSFASLFTSLPPQAHGAGGNVLDGWTVLDESNDTFAEGFQRAGYDTGAIVNVDFLAPAFGLMQGFDTVDVRFAEDNEHVRRAAPTTDAALAWLARPRAAPFLLLVHYFDAHAEYDPLPEYRARFAEPEDRDNRGFRFGTREHVVQSRAGKLAIDAAMMKRAEALYDGEVAAIDAEIGRLIAHLRASGLDRSTVIVFTADHGEEFLDHGGWEHGHTLYDELLHVPLIVKAPAWTQPRTVDDLVALIDVAPTLCALCGVTGSARFTGRDLSAAALGAPLEARAVTAYGNFWGAPLESWRDARTKLIRYPQAAASAGSVQSKKAAELFAWRTDPREKDDLARRDSGATASANAAYEEWLGRAHLVPAKHGAPVHLDPQARSRLEGVGYIQTHEPK